MYVGYIGMSRYVPEKYSENWAHNSHLKQYFQQVRGVTTSSYIVYDCNTSGLMELSNIYLQYIQYMYIFIQYTYNSV